MLSYKEFMGSTFCVDDTGKVIYEVTEPVILFDKDLFTLIKIGNKDAVAQYFEEAIRKCINNKNNLYESWLIMDIPKDAELMDKILNNTGYLELFLIKMNLNINNFY